MLGLDYTLRIGSTPTILYFHLYLYSASLPTQHTTFISLKKVAAIVAESRTRSYVLQLLQATYIFLMAAILTTYVNKFGGRSETN